MLMFAQGSTQIGLLNIGPKMRRYLVVGLVHGCSAYIIDYGLLWFCFIPGYTLVCATNEGLHARVSALATAEIHFDHTRSGTADHAADIVSCTLPLELDQLLEAAKNGGFFSYIAGTTAIVLQSEKYKFKQMPNREQPAGLLINNYLTTLPMRKGLSSSAAVCVLVATAFSRLFDLRFSQEEIMEIAFQVSNKALQFFTFIPHILNLKSVSYTILLIKTG